MSHSVAPAFRASMTRDFLESFGIGECSTAQLARFSDEQLEEELERRHAVRLNERERARARSIAEQEKRDTEHMAAVWSRCVQRWASKHEVGR